MGKTGAVDPTLLEPAMQYVRIRALAMPAAAMLGSAQTACLGMRDVKSPLYVTLVAAVVNLLVNWLFLGVLGQLHIGLVAQAERRGPQLLLNTLPWNLHAVAL